MYKIVPGQRFYSEAELELGVGRVTAVEPKSVTLEFPAVKEKRIYRIGVAELQRYKLEVGEIARGEKGMLSFPIASVKEENGLLVYYARAGKKMKESELSSKLVLRPSNYFNALAASELSSSAEYALRKQGTQISCAWRSSPVRGMIGPRVDSIPHQFYLCSRACSGSELPRLMLSDEVGLGKTIEAGMIWHTLKTRGRVTRTLILVPESLKHQWMVEMKRRFNHVFTLVDKAFLQSLSEERENFSFDGPSTVSMKENPFLATNDAICTIEFLMENAALREDLLKVTWDMLIVDEAHHLVCEDGFVSKEYQIVERVMPTTKGALLLTGTPLQLQPESHFNRLKMLDPVRFYDYEKFLAELETYKKIAADLAKLPTDPNAKIEMDELKAMLPKNSPIHAWLESESAESLEAGEWIRRIVDAMGTGSVVFRNTRKGVGGFPKRLLKEVPLEANATYRQLVDAMCKQDPDHATDYQTNGLLSFPKANVWALDERLTWLKNFLHENPKEKVLLITEDERVLKAIAAALLHEFEPGFATCFFEEMFIEERDRASADFSRKNGATILLSSEIGSEGRNFQFAHRLVLWDLPLDSALVEQRIGRLDRIGQTKDVEIYVPYVKRSGQEVMFRWYNDGLDAFGQPLMNGGEFFIKYTEELLQAVIEPETYLDSFVKDFLPKLKKEVDGVRKLAEKGRDKLLEFNSRNPEAAKKILSDISDIDSDKSIPEFVLAALKMQGVDSENGSLPESILLTQGDQVEDGSIPGMPATSTLGMTEESATQKSMLTVTLSRERAMMHDGIEFLSVEHPLAQGAIDYATSNMKGGVACSVWDNSGHAKWMLMEYAFVAEFPTSPEWGLDDVAGPRYLRVVVNGTGEDHSEILEELDKASAFIRDASIPQGNAIMNSKLAYFAGEGFEAAKRIVSEKVSEISVAVGEAVEERLEAEYRRTRHLSKIRGTSENAAALNDAKKAIQERKKAVMQSTLRLDAIRLIVCK